jgi:hypothetical protein
MMVRACLQGGVPLLRVRCWCFAFAFLLISSLLFSPHTFAQSASASSTPETGAPAALTANPGRPTVSTPATLTPVGYLQFETGMLSAWTSPEFSSQTSLGEVMKVALTPRFQLLAGAEPLAYSRLGGPMSRDVGDVLLGAQAVVHQGEGVNPTIALGYFGRVYSGTGS